MPQISFATLMIIFPTLSFLGIVFPLIPHHYPPSWANDSLNKSYLDALESHLRLLNTTPDIGLRILYILTALGLFGFLAKLFDPSGLDVLVDGGSLLLYTIAITVYFTNFVPVIQAFSSGTETENGSSVSGRQEKLKLLGASSTILAIVLTGILAIQLSQCLTDMSADNSQIVAAKKKAGNDDGRSFDEKKSSKKKESRKLNWMCCAILLLGIALFLFAEFGLQLTSSDERDSFRSEKTTPSLLEAVLKKYDVGPHWPFKSKAEEIGMPFVTYQFSRDNKATVKHILDDFNSLLRKGDDKITEKDAEDHAMLVTWMNSRVKDLNWIV